MALENWIDYITAPGQCEQTVAQFNGVSSSVELPIAAETATDKTLIASFNYVPNNNYQTIYKQWGSNPYRAFSLIVTPDGYVETDVANSSSYETLRSTTPLVAGEVYEVAAIYTYQQGQKLYINGQLDNSRTTSIAINPTTPQHSPSIGVSNYDGAYYHLFNGWISRVRKYDRELTADEITTSYGEHTKRFTGDPADLLSPPTEDTTEEPVEEESTDEGTDAGEEGSTDPLPVIDQPTQQDYREEFPVAISNDTLETPGQAIVTILGGTAPYTISSDDYIATWTQINPSDPVSDDNTSVASAELQEDALQ